MSYRAEQSEVEGNSPDGTGVSLPFKRQKGCVARESNLAKASLSSEIIYCNNLIIDERYPSGDPSTTLRMTKSHDCI